MSLCQTRFFGPIRESLGPMGQCAGCSMLDNAPFRLCPACSKFVEMRDAINTQCDEWNERALVAAISKAGGEIKWPSVDTTVVALFKSPVSPKAMAKILCHTPDDAVLSAGINTIIIKWSL